MAAPTQYTKPPVSEAYVALRVRPSVDHLPEGVGNPEPKFYSVSEQIRLRSVEIQPVAGDLSRETTDRPIGHAYSTQDGQYSAQILRDGMVFNWVRASPELAYPGWELFTERSQAAWSHCRSASSPEELAQVEVRFVNQLVLPVPADRPASLEDYLRTLPDLSRDLPSQDLSGYLLKLDLPQTELSAMAVVHQALLPSKVPHSIIIGLDIHMIRSADLPSPDDEEAIWAIVTQLHERGKAIFEASITARTRATFTDESV